MEGKEDGVLQRRNIRCLEGWKGEWAILGTLSKGDRKCEGPKAGPCVVYLRSIEKPSVTKVKRDDVTEGAGPGHTQPLLWDFEQMSDMS